MYWNEEQNQAYTQDHPEYSQAWKSFGTEIYASGKVVNNSGLSPTSSAATVRQADGKTLLSDGPFSETKEQLGGYFLIEAENLDGAISWARKFPHLSAGGAVEIRPVWGA